MEKLYMITLIGQGDTEIALVDEESWNWLNNPKDASKFPLELASKLMGIDNGYSTPPYNGVQEYISEKISEIQTSGSPDNDAALFIVAGCDQIFYNTMGAISYVRENNIEIMGSYEGCIY